MTIYLHEKIYKKKETISIETKFNFLIVSKMHE